MFLDPDFLWTQKVWQFGHKKTKFFGLHFRQYWSNVNWFDLSAACWKRIAMMHLPQCICVLVLDNSAMLLLLLLLLMRTVLAQNPYQRDIRWLRLWSAVQRPSSPTDHYSILAVQSTDNGEQLGLGRILSSTPNAHENIYAVFRRGPIDFWWFARFVFLFVSWLFFRSRL